MPCFGWTKYPKIIKGCLPTIHYCLTVAIWLLQSHHCFLTITYYLNVAILLLPEHLPPAIKDIFRQSDSLGFWRILQPASHSPLVPLSCPLFLETRTPNGVSNLQSLSAGEIGNTLKTKSKATTIAFTNHERLLQHILLKVKQQSFGIRQHGGHLPCHSDGHLGSTLIPNWWQVVSHLVKLWRRVPFE